LILSEGSVQWERYGLSALYCQAVAEVGGVPLLIPGLGIAEAALGALAHLDGLLLTGGPDVHPARYGQGVRPGCERIDGARDATELALIAEARRNGMPVLGICRGIQMLNVGFGGTLLQDIGQERPSSLDHRGSVPVAARTCHEARIDQGSRLATFLETSTIPVNSLHHQAVDTVAPGFVASAHAADGIVEAIEDRMHPFRLGVQCHPEHLFRQDPRWLSLFGAFVKAAAAWRAAQSPAMQ
jgi:putative glutamine amidotransferase